MQYLDVACSLAALFLLCAFLTLKCRLSSALAPLAALSLVSLVLTLAGVADLLYPAAWLLYAACLVLGVWALAPRPGKTAPGQGNGALERARPDYAALLTPGSILFWSMAVCFAVYFACRKPLFTDYDELSFWGTAARLTKVDDRLYTTASVGWAWQATQNPGMITLGYFVQFLGEYADWKIYLAYDLLAFACFGAVLGALPLRRWRVAVPATAVCWCVPFFFTTYNHTVYLCTVYLTAYGDIPAGLVVGAAVAFWLALRRQGGPKWTLLPVLALAANIKSNTFVLSLVSAGLVAADWLLFAPEGRRWRQGLAARAGYAAACFASPMLVYLVWNKYIVGLVAQNAAEGGMGTTSQPLASVAVNGIRMSLGLPVEAYYEERRAQYFTACGDMLEQFLHSRMSMIGSGVLVVVFILAVFAAAFILADSRALRARTAVLCLLSGGGFLAYNFMLALSYGFVFKAFQAANLEDYNRYIYTYYIAWFLIALAALCLTLCVRARWDWLGQAGILALAVLMLVRLNQIVLPQLSVLGFSDGEFSDRQIQQERAAAVAAQLDQDSRLFYVRQGDNGLHWFTACYDFYPIVVDYSGFGGGTFGLAELDPDNESAESYYYHPCTAEEFAEIVAESGCDYIYLDAIDHIFIESYAQLFSDELAAARANETLLYAVTDVGYQPVEMEVPE